MAPRNCTTGGLKIIILPVVLGAHFCPQPLLFRSLQLINHCYLPRGIEEARGGRTCRDVNQVNQGKNVLAVKGMSRAERSTLRPTR